MTDQPKTVTSEVSETPGMLLKAAREKRGLQQSGVAERLHLSVQTIIDIENDDFTHFPAEIYLRGHIRSFARLVNFDENRALHSYESMGVVFENDNHERFLNKQISSQSARSPRSKRRALLWVTFTVLLLLVIMVMLWWQEQRHPIFRSLSKVTRSTNTPLPIKTAVRDLTIQTPLVMTKKAINIVAPPIRHVASSLSVKKEKRRLRSRSRSKKHSASFIPDYKIAAVRR